LLHHYEVLYDYEKIKDVLFSSGYKWFSIFGFTVKDSGLLVKSCWEFNPNAKQNKMYTNIPHILASKKAFDRYVKFSTEDKMRILELVYKPNGYTLVAGKSSTNLEQMGERMRKNLITLSR